MRTQILFGITLIGLIFGSCSKENNNNSIEAPSTYTFERNGVSSVSYTGQTTRLAMAEELANAMLDFNSTKTRLLEMFANQTTAGDPASPFADPALNESTISIKSKVAASKDFFASNTAESSTIRADFEAWIHAQVNEVFPNRNMAAGLGVPGQIADGTIPRYVNAGGLEYNQLLSKGLVGAVMTDQMLNNYLSTSVLDEGENIAQNDNQILVEGQNYTHMEHKWDEAYGYLFGASVNPSNPLTDLGSDNFLNKYLARVENDPDFSGIASDIWEAFKLGRAAIVAGNYDIRDEQANIIRELVSKIIAIRAVYYLQQGKFNLPETGMDFGTAFHDLSEGAGFIYSLRFTRKPYSQESYFTKEEVDYYLNQLTEGNGFWDITDETLDEISQEIANRFDFSVEMASN
jgi:hypothetical protein